MENFLKSDKIIISMKIKENKNFHSLEESKKITIEILKCNEKKIEEHLKTLLKLEKENFGNAFCPRELLKKILKKGIVIVVKKNRKIIGYILSLPLKECFRKLKNDDKELEELEELKKEIIYVESTAFIKEERGNPKIVKDMFVKFLKKVREKGYKKIIAYISSQKFSLILKKIAKAKILRKIENWRNLGLPVVFIKIDNIEEIIKKLE